MLFPVPRRAAIVAVAGLAVLVALRPAAGEDARPLTVFAAASLAGLMADVEAAAADGRQLRLVHGSSGQLARQIAAGAAADAVISADPKWTDYLLGEGALADPQPTTLFSNRLVMVAPRGSDLAFALEPGVDIAGFVGDGRLAIGDPAHVPAGAYAKAALEWLGAWDAVSPHLALGDDVRQALAWVARGEAPLGIVYYSDAVAEPDVHVVAAFPAVSYGPILYTGAAVKGGDVDGARRLLDFLGSSAAAPILERHGFAPLAGQLRPPS